MGCWCHKMLDDEPARVLLEKIGKEKAAVQLKKVKLEKQKPIAGYCCRMKNSLNLPVGVGVDSRLGDLIAQINPRNEVCMINLHVSFIRTAGVGINFANW